MYKVLHMIVFFVVDIARADDHKKLALIAPQWEEVKYFDEWQNIEPKAY